MVIKGKARGGPAALATHLERRDTNEEVFIRELRGVTARNLRGALREMDCMGSGATSVRTLYHAAINTAPDERLSDEQKQIALDRLEAELGFAGQPRVVVEHLKNDRQHLHVVFLRIDTDRMVAINDSHTYRKHEIVARDLEREFGHRHVQGAHIDRDGKPRPSRTPGHDEMQQAERSGLSPEQAKQDVTRLWNQADSGKAFAAAVTAEGWILAQGHRRDFVLVDRTGETHSLARRVEGVRAADIRQRLADVDPASLPSIAEAKALQRAASNQPVKEKQKQAARSEAPALLKVAPFAGGDHAQPLLMVERAEQPAFRVEKVASSRKAEGKPKPPQPNKLQQLYTTAAGITQRVYTKVKGTFEKKEVPTPIVERPTETLKPVRPAFVPPPIRAQTKPAQPIRSKPDRSSAPTPSSQKRVTREELDAMIGRQRQQRQERSGPSR